MTNRKIDLKINEIISYLDSTDKSVLNELKEEFPSQEASLEPGIIMNDGDSLNEEEYKFRITVVERGLNTAISKGNIVFLKLQSRLKNLNKVDFWSQVVSLVSGAAILALINKDFESPYYWIKYIAPCLVLISSLLSLYVKNRAQPFLGGSDDLYKITNKFVDLRTDANHILSELNVYRQFFAIDKVKPLVDSSSQLIKDLEDFIVRAS